MPCAVASWPLIGTGCRCLAFRSAITAPAMLSFAARTASILLFVFTSIWVKIVAAFVASQSGTNCCGPLVSAPLLKSGLNTASLPLLNQNAFWSVWPPQSSATTGFELYLPLADGLAVERDVDGGGATEHLAVIVDRLATLGGEQLLDRGG